MAGGNRLKEKTKQKKSSKHKLGALENLFGKARGQSDSLPEVVQNRAVSEGRKAAASPIHFENTFTQTERLNALPKISGEAGRSQSNPSKQGAPQAEKKSKRSALFFVLCFLAFAGSASLTWMSLDKQVKAVASLVKVRLAERVAIHKEYTGVRMNRERITTQFENEISAPKLTGEETRIVKPDLMQGLPLVGEQPRDTYNRDRLQQSNLGYPDISASYTVLEEQEAQTWEKRAREEYVKDFIQNARRDGVKVEVDKQGNVDVVGRDPSSVRRKTSRSDRTGGGTAR